MLCVGGEGHDDNDDDDDDWWWWCVISFTSVENGGRGSTTTGSTACWLKNDLSPPPTTWQGLHLGPYSVPQNVASTQMRNGSTERNGSWTTVKAVPASPLWYSETPAPLYFCGQVLHFLVLQQWYFSAGKLVSFELINTSSGMLCEISPKTP